MDLGKKIDTNLNDVHGGLNVSMVADGVRDTITICVEYLMGGHKHQDLREKAY